LHWVAATEAGRDTLGGRFVAEEVARPSGRNEIVAQLGGMPGKIGQEL